VYPGLGRSVRAGYATGSGGLIREGHIRAPPLPQHSTKLLLGGTAFSVVGVWLAAASAIDPAAIRLGHPLPTAVVFAAAALLIAGDWLFCSALIANPGRATGRMQALLNATVATLAGLGCVLAWRAAPVPVTGDIRVISGLILVLGAFPVLVLERTFAGTAVWDFAFLLRVPLVALLGVGIGELLRAAGFAWPGWIEQAVGILVLLVAIELLLRSFATAFMPPPALEDLRPIARSMLARAIRPAWPSVRGLNAALEQQVGIDLQRSWALGFVARAAIPVSLGITVIAWLVTGLTSLQIDQRAVYERFGIPVAVLGPGLHLHLPWPLGILRSVEFGVLHDVPMSIEPAQGRATPIFGAEDEPPPSDDRLWDGTHPAEMTYLIASEESGQQGFQVVDLDLRLVWRVALSDKAALEAVANDADPDALVRSVGAQVLVQTFADRSLPALLSADRETLGAALRQQSQRRLDALASGVELVAVVIEAIHPPPAAADAYHAVQAAGIRSQIAVADETGGATESRSVAQQTAIYELDAARGGAATTLEQARGDAALFAGEQQAYQVGGQAVLLERWFDDVIRALGNTELLILDHRLAGGRMPTIDLRPPLVPGQTLPGLGRSTHPQSEPN
jgi:regulator of protease activity HflC (stomatin/prohibitin superfamily)